MRGVAGCYIATKAIATAFLCMMHMNNATIKSYNECFMLYSALCLFLLLLLFVAVAGTIFSRLPKNFHIRSDENCFFFQTVLHIDTLFY